jgi:hypothetical protein
MLGESKCGRQHQSIEPSHAHQRDRVQVADDAVGLDRLVGHFVISLSINRDQHHFQHSVRKSQFQPHP